MLLLQADRASFSPHAYIQTAAMLMVLLPLRLSLGARGMVAGALVDKDPVGAPYAAGELLAGLRARSLGAGRVRVKLQGPFSFYAVYHRTLADAIRLEEKVLTTCVALPPPRSDFS